MADTAVLDEFGLYRLPEGVSPHVAAGFEVPIQPITNSVLRGINNVMFLRLITVRLITVWWTSLPSKKEKHFSSLGHQEGLGWPLSTLPRPLVRQ